MTGRRRVYAEMMPLRELGRAPILAELARRRIELVAAVQPSDRADAVALVERARELGLAIGLWPLLPNTEGRWLHAGNARRFVAEIEHLLEALDERALAIDTMLIDLEPPITELRRMMRWDVRALRVRPLDPARLTPILAELGRREIEVMAAVVPPVVLGARAGRGWQRALGAPVDALGFDVVSAMLYTSLAEGYSAGALRRGDARALLAELARLTHTHFGARASVSLGVVGVGALGDERTYREPAELAADVAIARGAGVDDLALFDLAGVLTRPPAERWLDAFTETAPSTEAPRSLRARLALAALHGAGLFLDRLSARGARRS